MKNPFKKQSIVDTLVNVGIGGAANVAVNYAFNEIDMLSNLTSTEKNAIKIAIGVLGGSMSSNKYVRAAVDGVAVVGVSDLIDSYMAKEDEKKDPITKDPITGLPNGMIGYRKVRRAGNPNFIRSAVRGIASPENFMGK